MSEEGVRRERGMSEEGGREEGGREGGTSKEGKVGEGREGGGSKGEERVSPVSRVLCFFRAECPQCHMRYDLAREVMTPPQY